MCVRSQRSLTEPDSLPPPLAEPQTISNGSCSHESRTISDGENITVTEKIGCSKFTCRNSVLNRLYDGCMYEEECYPFNFTFQGNKGDCFLYRCVTGSYHDKYGAYHETIERVKVSPLCKDINGHCWKRGQTFTSLSQDGDKRVCECDISHLKVFYDCEPHSPISYSPSFPSSLSLSVSLSVSLCVFLSKI